MSRWDEYPTTMGQVVSVDVDASVAMVEVAGAEVPASLPDHLWYGTSGGLTVGPGAPVTLLRVLGGYQVVSSFTGADGAGAPTLGPELLANGGFESGIPGGPPDGWESFDYSWALTDDSPLEGLQSVRCEFTDDAESRALFRQFAARVDPGLTYRLSGFVSAVTTAGVPSARLEVLTGATDDEARYFGAGTLQTVATLANPGEAWPVLSGDFTAPAGHSFIRVAVKVFGALGTVSTVRFDALSLRQRLA